MGGGGFGRPYIMYISKKNLFRKQTQHGNRVDVRYLDACAVLDEANIPYREQGKNVGQGWIGVCCPFCADTGFHMGINLDSKSISCWKCGTTGNILKLLAAITGSFKDGLRLTEKIAGKTLYHKKEIQIENENIEVQFPKGAIQGLQDAHKNYLKKARRMNPLYLADTYNLYSTGPKSNMPNRIIVPVVYRYRLITYTTISVEEKPTVRYWHCPNDKSLVFIKHFLYNIETVKHRAFVVEGIFDTWRMGNETVCTFGVKPTEQQIRLLSQIQNVYVVFDGDVPGYTGARNLAEKLSAFTNVQIVELPKGTDPDTLSRADINLIKSL